MHQLRLAVWIMVLASVAVLDGIGQERSKVHEGSPYINYIAWNGTKWSAKPDGKGFMIAEEGNWKKGISDDHIAYTGWNGTKWEAKHDGNGFLIAPEGDWKKAVSSDHIDYITWDRQQWRAWLQDRAFRIEEH